MRRSFQILGLLACFALVFGCRGYQAKRELKITPDEQKIIEMSARLANDANTLDTKASDIEELKHLSDAADEFDHNVGRYGSQSLEVRNSFDNVRFQATQAEKTISEANRNDLITIQAEIKEIGRLLGYKDEE